MFQALSNLIGNATKFTAEGGRITIGVQKTGRGLHFSVADTGAGIAKEHLEHIFDRYWQARESSKSGSGLGLAIVKGIVEAHHGQVGVNSAFGVGSTFYFDIPMNSN